MSTILTDFYDKLENQSQIYRFIKRFELMDNLKAANITKIKGYSLLHLFQFLIGLIFTGKNFFRYMDSNNGEDKPFAKDIGYRFLNNPKSNWRLFLLKLSSKIINDYLNPLTNQENPRVLIFDDSLYSRNRSKKVELLARVYDHVEHRYVKGFRKLTAGWSDGVTFIPLAFTLLSSADPKKRLYEQGPELPANCPGTERRAEAILKTTDVVIKLLDQILEYTQSFNYVLFDSWFSWPNVIQEIKERKLDTICMLKDMPHIKYGYGDNYYRLSDLYAHLGNKTRDSDIIGSLQVDYYGIPARVVFVCNRNNKREWLALLSTDLSIPDEEIIRIYGMRWDIEVYFKMCKSFLGMAKEFKVRSYNAMTAHTTLVCVRYMLLAVANRDNNDDRSAGGIFYELCDEIDNISFSRAMALLISLFTNLIREKLFLTDQAIDDILQQFIELIPSNIKKRLLIVPA